MTFSGIDIGSTYTKYCVMNENGAAYSFERTPIQQRVYFAEKLSELRRVYPECQIVSCGYGKHNIHSVKSVTELSALAVGLNAQEPEVNIALDIGGQDTKIIRQKDGKLKEFFINDKCAAGSGLFLTNTLNILGTHFSDIVLSGETDDIKLSSVCAVFAQSEIVELIASGVNPAEIIQATLRQILTQAAALLNKIDCNGAVALSGGLTQIPGMKLFAEKQLKARIIIPNNAAYLSALGCAIIAKEEYVCV
jgi:predicted CoA-substrate-specific enzyme activase